jgi:4-hydroxy-tetrahydrodipicolinate reductase
MVAWGTRSRPRRARGHEVVSRLDQGEAIDRTSLAGAEVALDFTLPGAVLDNARRVGEAGVDRVIGTTGWYDRKDELAELVDDAGIGCLWSPNFSLGVQLFLRLAAAAGKLADALDEYDVYVHEAHHRHKVDHPSGTARRLAEILVETLARKERWAEAPAAGAPETNTLWVGSTRSGEVPGTHIVGLEGPDDTIELRHTARGRGGFARGAVSAAAWIQGRKGFFGIEEMLADRFGDKH